MVTFLSIVYVVVCLFLILVVLLQSGRGGGLGSIGGGLGSASQQVFGGAGAGNILTKATSIAAALFMILSVTLSWLSSPGDQALEAAAAEMASGSASEPDATEPEATGPESIDTPEATPAEGVIPGVPVDVAGEASDALGELNAAGEAAATQAAEAQAQAGEAAAAAAEGAREAAEAAARAVQE